MPFLSLSLSLSNEMASATSTTTPLPYKHRSTLTTLLFLLLLFSLLFTTLLFIKPTLPLPLSLSLSTDLSSQPAYPPDPNRFDTANDELSAETDKNPKHFDTANDELSAETDKDTKHFDTHNDEISAETDKDPKDFDTANGEISAETDKDPKHFDTAIVELSAETDKHTTHLNATSDELSAATDNGPKHLNAASDELSAGTEKGPEALAVNEVDPRVKALEKCDLYSGSWVRDEAYPIYRAGSCPFVDEAFDCQANGRTDHNYLAWRWKPHACHLPKFNATDFLVRIRGKKMMLVGDSMNRNQFESILCLLREGLRNKSTMYEVHGHKITKGRGYYVFKFEDYNCTVDFVRSHFLVREGVRINGDGNSNPTLSIDRIDKTSPRWKRADILVFNTGHWWAHGKTSRGKNYFKEGDHVYPQFDAVEAYRRSLKTWSDWIDKNVNPEKQLVIYRGYSSAHFRGGDWDSGGSCNGEIEPAFSGAILDNYPLKMKIVEETIKSMRVPVKLLNITRLTNFRKDGHPSIYGKNATAGKKVSKRRQDCSHWCLPGVPDAWNELIYATLLLHQTDSAGNNQ